ncbi:protein FAR1-RELATED SEQUENCE 5-like [Rhizophagus irregularis DAOM 181602=DAOM 197198]|nr:protein FAR1-RELATED SEQUENCE 5-like [Rhizophagus irregularis DAOM 181602=DAOM 197198]
MDNINLNKENTLPKSIVSRQNRLRVLQELQTSDNLKEQALELQNTYHRVDGSVNKKVFECHHAGKPKTDSNPRVTTFEPGHKNHNLNTLTAIFTPSYHSLPESDNSHSEVNDSDNDAFWLLEMLENQQKEDPRMFIAKKIHQGRLFHIFWMDSNQQELYQYYHNVIVTDNTSRTNKYHMALCIFVGVDNQNYTRIFAQALLSDEISASYTWVLEQLLEANNGITPTIIISDADTGLDVALKPLLPYIKHIYCIFHIR